jgi:hypothetical protein
MRTFSLSPYTIRISRANDFAAGYLPVDHFDNRHDLLRVLHDYFQDLSANIFNDTVSEFILRVANYGRHGHSISGQLEKGDYGIESEIIDTVRHTLSYDRVVVDAELLPFYFLIVIPPGANEAIAIFQMSGVSGIKGIFEDNFEAYFTNRFPEYHLEINRLIPSQLIDQMLTNCRVTKLRFVRYGIPTDITDLVNLGHNEDEGIVELQVKAKRGRAFPMVDRIRQVIQGDRNVNRFLELQHFEYNSVKIELEIAGKYRTIDLLHLDNFRAQYNITGDIVVHGGNPVFESINEVARNLCREILLAIYGTEIEGV